MISEFQGDAVPRAGGKRTCYCCFLSLHDTNNAHLLKKISLAQFHSLVLSKFLSNLCMYTGFLHTTFSLLNLQYPPIPTLSWSSCFLLIWETESLSKELSKLPPQQPFPSCICALLVLLVWISSSGPRLKDWFVGEILSFLAWEHTQFFALSSTSSISPPLF